jgi:serine/threonine protein kinase
MAEVYLGRATGAAGFSRDVAIKLCHSHLTTDQDFRTMFLDEARLAARIQHPNVVSTIDVADDAHLYIVMEYVEGGSANELMTQSRKSGAGIPTPIALRIVADALAGLHAAHEALDDKGEPLNLVHRDVSPQNLVVGVDGVTRVADFGIAKSEARATVTSGHQLKGKLSYMAPEQLQHGELSRRTDVFAAAVVLWELLTKKRLFASGEGRADIIQKILFAPIRNPSSVNPALPAELDAVVMKGLERDPSHRYETARAFVEALESRGALATHREVGDFVSSTLAASIAERRAILAGMSDAVTREGVPDVGGESHVRETKILAANRSSMPWIAAIVVATLCGVVGAYLATTYYLSEAGAEAETIADADADSDSDSETIADVDSDSETIADVDSDSETIADVDSDSETGSETETELPTEAAPAAATQRPRPRPAMRRRHGRRSMSMGEFRPNTL